MPSDFGLACRIAGVSRLLFRMKWSDLEVFWGRSVCMQIALEKRMGDPGLPHRCDTASATGDLSYVHPGPCLLKLVTAGLCSTPFVQDWSAVGLHPPNVHLTIMSVFALTDKRAELHLHLHYDCSAIGLVWKRKKEWLV